MLATIPTTLGATARHAEGALVVLLLRSSFLSGLRVDGGDSGRASGGMAGYPLALAKLKEVLYNREL